MNKQGYGLRAHFEDARFLSEHFLLGSLRFTRDLGGTYNLNLLLSTAQGRYVLRLHRPWVTPGRLAYLHEVKRRLARAGLPVPLPLPTRTGRTFLRYRDRLLEVEPFIAHDYVADSWERMAVAFALLGRLHAFLAGECATLRRIDPVVSNYGTPDQLLDWTRQAASKAAQLPEEALPQERQQILDVYSEASDLLASLRTRWRQTYKQLPRQLTHGDYGGGNLLFLQGRIVAILDFDFLRVRERVFELAYSLYWWLWGQAPGQGIADEVWSQVKGLLAAYNAAAPAPLAPAEIEALPLEMARVPLYWIAETHLFPNPAQEVVKWANRTADARWLMERRDHLVDLLGPG